MNPIGLLSSLLFFAALAAPGVSALGRFVPEFSRVERTAYGVPLGFVGGTLGLLALACVFGLTSVLVVLWALLCVVLAVILSARKGRPDSAADERKASGFGWHRPGLIASGLVLLLFVIRWTLLWSNALSVDEHGLSVGWVNLWGDWAQHLGDVSTFAWGDNFPPVQPRLWGHAFPYHYLTSVTVAAAVRLGLDPVVALPLHSFLLSVTLLLALHTFAQHFTGRHAVATLAVALFLLGAGWGFRLPIQAAITSHAGPLSLLARPWDSAAQQASNYRWQNLYFSLIAPQRAFLYGLPLGLLVLRLLDAAVREHERRFFLLAGVVAGMLPLAHQGTLLSLALTTPFLMVLFPSPGWVLYFGAWAAVGVPQLLPMIHGGANALGFTRVQLGWMAAPDPWVWFWLKNLGLFLPLTLAGFLWRAALPDGSRRFLLGLMPVFAAANLFVFQPWDWYNIVILTFWFLAVCILSAAVITTLWSRRGPLMRIALAVVVVSLTLSGLLVNLDELLGRDRHLLLTREELDLARAIRERTPPRSMFATGQRHNHPVTVLGGRRVIVGYPGWLWSQGFHYQQEERDLRSILAFSPEARGLMDHYGVDFVAIGPEEREQLGAREDLFAARYPTVIRTAQYRVFAVSRGR